MVRNSRAAYRKIRGYATPRPLAGPVGTPILTPAEFGRPCATCGYIGCPRFEDCPRYVAPAAPVKVPGVFSEGDLVRLRIDPDNSNDIAPSEDGQAVRVLHATYPNAAGNLRVRVSVSHDYKKDNPYDAIAKRGYWVARPDQLEHAST